MSDAASIAFCRIVALVLSGALTLAEPEPDQAASERMKQILEERARLKERLAGTGVHVPAKVTLRELRVLAATAGICELAQRPPLLAAFAAGVQPA